MTTIEDRISAALALAGERLHRHEDGSYSIESAGSIGLRRYGLEELARLLNVQEQVSEGRTAQISRQYEELQEILPGYLFTMLDLFTVRELLGDSMHQELEALIKGLNEDGEIEEDDFDRALEIIEALPLRE